MVPPVAGGQYERVPLEESVAQPEQAQQQTRERNDDPPWPWYLKLCLAIVLIPISCIGLCLAVIVFAIGLAIVLASMWGLILGFGTFFLAIGDIASATVHTIGGGSTNTPIDVCRDFTNCADCHGISQIKSHCGWCVEFGFCARGNSSGPFEGSCSSSNWISSVSTATCPISPTICALARSCSQCQDVGCGWCDSSSSCLVGNSGGPTHSGDSCDSYYFNSCPTPFPRHPIDTPFPSEGNWALVSIASTSITILLLSLACAFKVCIVTILRPINESALDSAPAILFAGLAIFGLICKVMALGYDQWDKHESGTTTYIGLLQWHGQNGTNTSWSDNCNAYSQLNAVTDLKLCKIEQACGIVTLIMGIGSCLAASIGSVVYVRTAAQGSNFVESFAKMGSFTGLAVASSFGAVNFWKWGAHDLLVWQSGDNTHVSVSFILFFVGFFADFIAWAVHTGLEDQLVKCGVISVDPPAERPEVVNQLAGGNAPDALAQPDQLPSPTSDSESDDNAVSVSSSEDVQSHQEQPPPPSNDEIELV